MATDDISKAQDAQLIITEGLTDGLVARQHIREPVIAAVNSGKMPDIASTVDTIKPTSVTIIADNDKAGRKAARDLYKDITYERCGITILIPPDDFKDLADFAAQLKPDQRPELLQRLKELPPEAQHGGPREKSGRTPEPGSREAVVKARYQARKDTLHAMRERLSLDRYLIWLAELGFYQRTPAGQWEPIDEARLETPVNAELQSRCGACVSADTREVITQLHTIAEPDGFQEAAGKGIDTLSESWHLDTGVVHRGPATKDKRLTIDYTTKRIGADARGDLFAPSSLPFAWGDGQTDPTPQFNRFLNQATGQDTELTNLIKALIGRIILHDRTTHLLPLLYGPGGTGKGVLTAIITACIGAENTTTISDPAALGGNHGTSFLRGKQLLLMTDLPQVTQYRNARERTGLAILKALVGGDAITANVKFTPQPVTITNPPTVLVSTNILPHWPESAQDAEAWERRFVPIPLEHKPANPNPHLA